MTILFLKIILVIHKTIVEFTIYGTRLRGRGNLVPTRLVVPDSALKSLLNSKLYYKI